VFEYNEVIYALRLTYIYIYIYIYIHVYNGAGGERGTHGEEKCWKRPKKLIRTGRKLTLVPRIN
jgi:hypothetical protein